MSINDLPAELLTKIFDFADEHLIYQYGLPNALAESAWFRTVFNGWTLRTPQEALNLIQRRNYITHKGIVATCRTWKVLGSPFLFRCLFFDDPNRLHTLCARLDTDSAFGWWTKRIHITRYYAGRGSTMFEMEKVLVSVVRHCPNLEIFVVDWPMGPSFGSIAEALSTYTSRSLRTIHWNVPLEALPKVIWALDFLHHLLCVHIEFEGPDSENLHLGSASDVCLTLRYLQQLSLRGYIQEFLEQATGWNLPSLKSLSLDCGSSRTDQPDAIEFLTRHGAELVFLDVYCIPPLDVPKILDLCPLLTYFAFNADWRLSTSTEDPTESQSTLVTLPHNNITHIGCHGLLYAFGVGYASTYADVEPLRSHMIRQSNDRNMAALTRKNFPKLKSIRALSRTVLHDLNEADGPDQSCYERWERWWNQCVRQGIRLEDCTGAYLGTLPEAEYPEGEEEEEEEEEDDEYLYGLPAVREGEEPSEIQKLLQECRKMDNEKDDDELFEEEGDEDEEDEDESDDEFTFNIPVIPPPEDIPQNELHRLLEECRKMEAERDNTLPLGPIGRVF